MTVFQKGDTVRRTYGKVESIVEQIHGPGRNPHITVRSKTTHRREIDYANGYVLVEASKASKEEKMSKQGILKSTGAMVALIGVDPDDNTKYVIREGSGFLSIPKDGIDTKIYREVTLDRVGGGTGGRMVKHMNRALTLRAGELLQDTTDGALYQVRLIKETDTEGADGIAGRFVRVLTAPIESIEV